jgi:fructokinase
VSVTADGKKTVVAIGEVLWDLLPDCTHLGGASFNFAYRVNSLGDCGLMVSRLGADDLGDRALEAVRGLGMATTYLQRDDAHATGTVNVSFDDKGMPDYFIVPDVAYDYIEPTEALRSAVAQADCLCFGTLVQRRERTRQTLQHLLEQAADCLKVLDINLRKDCYGRETVEYSLSHADLLKLNDDEVRLLSELLAIPSSEPVAFCQEIMARCPVQHCLVTFGESGALACSRTGEAAYEPGYRVEVADSIGSGDAFTAGFVHRYLHGATVGEACHFGNMLGAIVATQVGATQPVSPETLQRLDRIAIEKQVLPELQQYVVG